MHHGVGKQSYQRLNIDEITQYFKPKDAKSRKNLRCGETLSSLLQLCSNKSLVQHPSSDI